MYTVPKAFSMHETFPKLQYLEKFPKLLGNIEEVEISE
jgi:hypothetical protein